MVYSYVHVHNCRFFGGGGDLSGQRVNNLNVNTYITVVFVCFLITKIYDFDENFGR